MSIDEEITYGELTNKRVRLFGMGIDFEDAIKATSSVLGGAGKVACLWYRGARSAYMFGKTYAKKFTEKTQ